MRIAPVVAQSASGNPTDGGLITAAFSGAPAGVQLSMPSLMGRARPGRLFAALVLIGLQRHQVRRIPEVGGRRLFGTPHPLGDGRGRQARGVAGQDGVGRREALDLSEQRLLDRELFDDRFEHERRPWTAAARSAAPPMRRLAACTARVVTSPPARSCSSARSTASRPRCTLAADRPYSAAGWPARARLALMSGPIMPVPSTAPEQLSSPRARDATPPALSSRYSGRLWVHVG